MHNKLKMILFRIFLIILCNKNLFLGQETASQHFDLEEPIFFQSLVNNDTKSLFGLSFTFVKTNITGKNPTPRYWLFVGDPNGNASGTNENLERPGTVWKCSLSRPGVPECYTMDLDIPACSAPRCRANPQIENRNRTWAGSIVTSNDNRFITCAPRWLRGNPANYLMNGLCYWFDIKSMYSWSMKNQASDKLRKGSSQENRLIPFFWESPDGPNLKNQYFWESNNKLTYYAYGQAGVSAYVNEENNEVVIGAPGVRLWKGAVLKYQDSGKKFSMSSMERRNRNGQNEYANWVDVKNIGSSSYDYFGYAVTAGNYIKSKGYQYAGSSPRRSNLEGSVTIFSFPYEFKEYTETVEEIQIYCTTFGSYFGNSLLSVDVNNDGLDELIIGSPMYSEDNYKSRGDQGAVFIFTESHFKNSNKITSTELVRISSGLVGQARFGSAMISLGDLNEDRFNDFAIGAPFANGNEGVVFIYYGKPDLTTDWKYVQRISPSDFSASIPNLGQIKGFGSSFAVKDIDNNGTPDLGIGSFLSKTVGIFRSRPKMVINQRITYRNIETNKIILQIDGKFEQFIVESCIQIEGNSLSAQKTELELEVELIIDPIQNRFKFSNFTQQTIISDKGKLKFNVNAKTTGFTCNIFRASKIKEFGERNSPQINPVYFEQIVQYKVKQSEGKGKLYQITKEGPTIEISGENRNDNFSPNSPFPLKSSHFQELTINTDCQDVNNCESELEVMTWFERDGSRVNNVTLEWNNYLSFIISISNEGEPAYNPELILKLEDPNLKLKFGISKECIWSSNAGNEMKCFLDKKIEKSADKRIEIPFTLNRIYANKPIMKLRITTIVGTINKPESRANTTTELELEESSNMLIVGSIFPIPVFLRDVFHHDYEVALQGRSPIEILRFEFIFPVLFGGKVLLKIEKPETKLTCNYGKFEKLQSVFTTTPRSVDVSDGAEKSKSSLGVVGSRIRREAESDTDTTIKTNLKLEELKIERNTTYVGCNGFESKSISCETINCEIRKVVPPYQEYIVFYIQIESNSAKSLFQNNKKQLLVESFGEAKLLNGYMSSKTLSQAIVRLNLASGEEDIPLWIYIVSGICGLILLILIIICLFKFGFFKRAKREDLQNLIHTTAVEAEKRKTMMMVTADMEQAHM